MTIDELYSLIEDIEQEQKWLFIVYDKFPTVGVDILEWENEDCIDGGWFDSVEAAYKFCLEYQTNSVLRPLIAVAVESDQHGTFYLYPKLITSYQEAVEYELDIENKHSSFDLFSEYLLFPKGTDLEEVLKDLEEHEEYSVNYEDYYDIEEVQQYYGIKESTYYDGTVAVLGDFVIVDSNDLSWGIMKRQDLTGTVTLLDDPRYIQLKLDIFDREIRISHYLVRKNG